MYSRGEDGKDLYRLARDGGAEVWSLRERLPRLRQDQVSQPRAGPPKTTVTSPCASAAAMAYPEKSSQRSSVSSVSSHVRLSQSSSKSYSLLGVREQHVSTQQENSKRQGRQGPRRCRKPRPRSQAGLQLSGVWPG